MLRTKHETYAAAERMIETLGDQWSAFLPPSAFRRALRKPQPAERDYLAAYVRCRGLPAARRLCQAARYFATNHSAE